MKHQSKRLTCYRILNSNFFTRQNRHTVSLRNASLTTKSCWFSPCSQGFHRVLRFLLKKKFQILIRSGPAWKPTKTDTVSSLYIYFIVIVARRLFTALCFFSNFYSVVECADRIAREQDISAKRKTWLGGGTLASLSFSFACLNRKPVNRLNGLMYSWVVWPCFAWSQRNEWNTVRSHLCKL